MPSSFYLSLRIFFIRFFHWEYWPMALVYFPVSFYYVYLALRARSLCFFSAANPSIETGGMFFESKWSIFKLMPPSHYPKTLLVAPHETIDAVLARLNASEMIFPLMAKPDRGERGWGVRKLYQAEDLIQYKSQVQVDFLLQEYIDLPVELSVFYFRHPQHKKGCITSITQKDMLTVEGDGRASLTELILQSPRAVLQYQRLLQQGRDLHHVPLKGQVIELEPCGNHALGAKFINRNASIDEALCKPIDDLAQSIKGFYYGRFDLRCESIEAIKQGKGFVVLELNGAGADPAHIYQPGYSFFRAQADLAHHYHLMFQAAVANHASGAPYMSFSDLLTQLARQKNYRQNVHF